MHLHRLQQTGVYPCTSRANQDSFAIDAFRVSLIFGTLGRAPPDSTRSSTSASIIYVWQCLFDDILIHPACSFEATRHRYLRPLSLPRNSFLHFSRIRHDIDMLSFEIVFSLLAHPSLYIPCLSLEFFYQSVISANLFLACSSDRVTNLISFQCYYVYIERHLRLPKLRERTDCWTCFIRCTENLYAYLRNYEPDTYFCVYIFAPWNFNINARMSAFHL